MEALTTTQRLASMPWLARPHLEHLALEHSKHALCILSLALRQLKREGGPQCRWRVLVLTALGVCRPVRSR